MKVTITVDLDQVRNLCENIAKYNSGLETDSGLLPADFKNVVDNFLVKGNATNELRSLLDRIVEIHTNVHDKYDGKQVSVAYTEV